MSFDSEPVREEIQKWFFDDYLPHGIRLLSGEDDAGGKGFQNYWGTPLLVTLETPEILGTPDLAAWAMTDEEVFNLVQNMTDQMLAAGYRSTVVPDSRVVAYTPNGGAVEVIWSRRDGTGHEFQRLGVHFEVARLGGTWRFVAIHARFGDAARDQDSLSVLWSL